MKWISDKYHKFVRYYCTHPKYHVGDVWAYKTRDHEPDSLLCILHVDQCYRLGYIYHVWIYNLAFKNPYLEDGIQDVLPFSSFNEESLDLSLIEKVGLVLDLPDTKMLYDDWQHRFKLGEADPVIDTPIAECIQLSEDAIEGENI